MDSEIEPLVEAGTDDALIAFLRAELDLSYRYAETAKVEAGLDSESRARNLAKHSLETIHRFCNRITDPAIRLELQNGAAELEKLLSERTDTQI